MGKVLVGPALLFFVALIALGSFALGVRVGVSRADSLVDAVQSMHTFNSLLSHRELAEYLSRGCISESLEKMKIEIDQETKLLAEFHAKHQDAQVNKYISDRDPTLLAELSEFKSRYGNSWADPKCTK